ncbi:MAG: SDR family oxidoreductase, partial [Lentisphaeria bacterium]|nr:SDR family oxidoreductase [Lentisphaeria bacterium]
NLVSETLPEISEQMAVNFTAPVLLMQYFAKFARKPGCIINLLDQAVTRHPDTDAFGYLISKKALAEATECAALAYAPAIRVNGIAPGPVIAPPGLEHLNMEKTLKKVPLNRRVEPEDIAGAALFLAQNRSITGTILTVDGGQHIQNGERN